MDDLTLAPTVAAVVAAHNEAGRLGPVLDVLVSYPGFDQVIVVDDGSTDATAVVAEERGATCLRLPVNVGKGSALDRGIRHAGADVLFLADADIRRHLDHAIIRDLLAPVVGGEVDMFVAMRHRSIYRLRSVLQPLPLLGGERAVRTELWREVPDRYKHRFKIEAALNFYAIHHGRGLRYRVFPISQTSKEVKYGFLRGFVARLRMGVNVGAAIAEVHLRNPPANIRHRHRAVTVAVASVGVLLATAGHPASGRGHGPSHEDGSHGQRTRRHLPRKGLAVGSAVLALTQLIRLAQSPARTDG